VRRRLETLPEFRERPSQVAGGGSIEVWTPTGAIKTKLVDAASVTSGQSVDGGALIEGYSSTLWLPPAWRAVRDTAGNLIVSRISA
jgi:N-methylhydantoinase A